MIARMLIRRFLATCTVSSGLVANMVLADEITVRVVGAQSDDGFIVVCVWNSKEGFPLCTEDHEARTALNAAPTVEAVFSIDRSENYAITAFHDEDGNGRVKQNFIGIPKEPVAVSGPKQKRMGPPKFDSAAIQPSDGDLIELNLQ